MEQSDTIGDTQGEPPSHSPRPLRLEATDSHHKRAATQASDQKLRDQSAVSYPSSSLNIHVGV